MAAHQAPPSLGFARQEYWSGLPFPSPMHESEKWKWSRSVLSNSLRPHGLQPSRLLRPWDFSGKSTGVGCHHLLWDTFIGQHMKRASQLALLVKNPLTNAGDIEMWVWSLGQKDLLEKGMTTHSSILALRIPWTKEPHGWATVHRVTKNQTWLKWVHTHTHTHNLYKPHWNQKSKTNNRFTNTREKGTQAYHLIKLSNHRGTN